MERTLEAGGVVKAKPLTDNGTMKDFRQTYSDRAVVLFIVDAKRRLKVRPALGPFEPLSGETVIAIVPSDQQPVPHDASPVEPQPAVADDEFEDKNVD